MYPVKTFYKQLRPADIVNGPNQIKLRCHSVVLPLPDAVQDIIVYTAHTPQHYDVCNAGVQFSCRMTNSIPNVCNQDVPYRNA